MNVFAGKDDDFGLRAGDHHVEAIGIEKEPFGLLDVILIAGGEGDGVRLIELPELLHQVVVIGKLKIQFILELEDIHFVDFCLTSAVGLPDRRRAPLWLVSIKPQR